MAMKKIKLELRDSPFRLVAISSSDTLHRLAWLINKNLGLQLKESDSLKIQSGKKIENASYVILEFPTFKDEECHPEITYLLIKNKVELQSLLKELQNIDYLILINGYKSDTQYKNFVSQLKKIPNILAAVTINPSKISRIPLLLSL
jgi:hypothetical protein